MVFRLPVVNKCCCCFSLRTGCLIIGYVFIVFASLSEISAIWSLIKVIKYIDEHRDDPNTKHRQWVADNALCLYISHAYFILVYLYHFAMNLILVIGAHMNKPQYLRIYFVCGVVLLAMEVVLIIITAIFFSPYVSMSLLIWSVIFFYFLIVIRSAAIEMEEVSKPPAYEMNSVYNPHQSTPLMA